MIKGISVNQPFASLISMGYKHFETRVANSSCARTKYRGHLYICTSMKIHPVWVVVKELYFHGKNWKDVPRGTPPIDPYLKDALDKVWRGTGNNWELFCEKLIAPEKDPSAICEVYLDAIGDMQPEHQQLSCYSLYPGAKVLRLMNPRPIERLQISGKTNGFHLGIFDINVESTQITYLK